MSLFDLYNLLTKEMRKQLSLLAIAACALLLSCSDNSEEVFQETKPIKVTVQKTIGGSPIDFEKTF